MDIKISLNQEDFTKLIKGEVLEKKWVKIALQDIWYELMIDIIKEARINMYDNMK